MTKFIDRKNCNSKITIFRKYFDVKTETLKESRTTPSDWENVEYIGPSAIGDLFKCWNKDENVFALVFGTKGDEFNNE